MPTGYTSKLYDGEPQTFEEFVLSCAHAFGALIELRDEPLDSEVPEEIEPSPWYAEWVQKARDRLNELRSMSDDDTAAAARASYEEKILERAQSQRKRLEMRSRYQDMLAQVLLWEPPTADHCGLKDFMVEQLESSIEFDTKDYGWEVPKLTPSEWLAQEVERAERDVEYYAEEEEKEIKRARGRTEWIRELRGSLA